MPVSTDDYVSISDFLGRYCWAVDESETEAWVALWAEDGVFTGLTPEPVSGHAALSMVPEQVRPNNRRMRHLVGSLTCDYGSDGTDTLIARYYNLVTNWPAGGQMTCLAACTMTLRRKGDSWLIARNDSFTLT